MRVGKLNRAVMILALVLGQWLTLVHAFQHSPLDTTDAQCELCLHGQGLDSGAAPSIVQFSALATVQEQPQSTELPRPAVYIHRYYPIRAPPVLA